MSKGAVCDLRLLQSHHVVRTEVYLGGVPPETMEAKAKCSLFNKNFTLCTILLDYRNRELFIKYAYVPTTFTLNRW